jgi:hypothetical protein
VRAAAWQIVELATELGGNRHHPPFSRFAKRSARRICKVNDRKIAQIVGDGEEASTALFDSLQITATTASAKMAIVAPMRLEPDDRGRL